ncbi:PREDICTED: vitronectin, partial [Chlamydotis macqueenii]|uniref:vitronectin n=1 Tax=Chlamydotis macqueenii TaxID=187382 RepID=UPI0005297C43
MRLLFPALVLALLATVRAAEDSCVGRCDDGFDELRKCQCDTLCVYYQSCCSDYSTVCKVKVTRGDVFALPEDDYLDYNLTVDLGTEQATEAAPTELPTSLLPVPNTTPDEFGGRDPVEEPEELCSRKPFDAFTDLKNGSLYAFRGKYFYELDDTSVRPGYPKLISDVWGIEGPIDAAFTRINCQGKTYLFKVGRNKYYWSYDFAHQPTQADCEKSSPSAVFNHYAFMNRDSWEDIFQILFGGRERGSDARQHGVESEWLSGSQCKTLQSVYFFVGDKYYRVNLRTKRVDL